MSVEERPTIKTKRLRLRPFIISDADSVFEYANDPEWARYQVNITHPLTRKDAETLVTMFSDPSNWEFLQIFAIVLEDKVVGEIGLNQRVEDRQNERAELVYSLSRQHWGKGLMTEAAWAVINWAFRTYNLNKIYSTCDPRNNLSIRVLEKLGMSREGILRNHLKWNGESRDVMYSSILRHEWLSSHGE